MQLRPSFEELSVLDREVYTVAPVSCEILSDFITPIEALRILKKASAHTYLLESAQADERWGRFTFLGYDPKTEISCQNGQITIKEKDGEEKVLTGEDPTDVLRDTLGRYKSPRYAFLPPFTGGLVGYFSFDYLKYSEPVLTSDIRDEDEFKDMDLMLFDKVIAFDHVHQKIILIVNMKLSEGEAAYEKAAADLCDIISLLESGEKEDADDGRMLGDFTPLFDKERYCAMVEKGKRHIFEGDIFQIVLSNRFEAPYEGSLLGTYRILRTINPSPYMFYFSGTDVEVAGASPETLVKLEDGELHTFPLAGTRRRGMTEAEDMLLEKELLSDEKELAEHNMLVDLGRNDLGRIARFGTVEVENYMEVLRFSHVMHIGSTVRGFIREDKDALDAIEAVLPAGTLSGAPKIRACQLINELENSKRGIYGGAVGYIDFTGNMDMCIAIRLAYKKNGRVFVRSGAGIVADSVPEKEYEECINKAKAVIHAIKKDY